MLFVCKYEVQQFETEEERKKIKQSGKDKCQAKV